MKILLTGANGQLGKCFQDVIRRFNLTKNTKVELLARASDELNITDKISVMSTINDERPDYIVNAAAYTAVDKAESNAEQAYLVNESGVENLALAAAKYDIPLIHVSTDYVFDGEATAPYLPDDEVNPQSVYGMSKLAGELTLAKTHRQHIIFRTSWVFSEYGNNFVKTMIKLAKSRDNLSIVADQYGCPTYAGDIANTIFSAILKIENGLKPWGTYHYTGNLPTTWHGFARAIFSDAFTHKILPRQPVLRAINTDEYPLPAPRPSYSVLTNAKQAEVLFELLPDWRQALSLVISKLKTESSL
ncbi:dTDP-4-dehydrorhamnose reductase [Catenovulum maritimum]|uniref:dTDP-4-dehydrorhamnose reductase n=1 Tax=Catenovulum maritimum TaxID=1513271 RepID=A0A0J8GPE1_9ALTE|nr:dTDP-4-dehydrorhamnose reductase [Catenovulum maritimum]KMT64642.1 dTDP-4-dehydrorhamnose reductase [Catenovulum maritimum]